MPAEQTNGEHWGTGETGARLCQFQGELRQLHLLIGDMFFTGIYWDTGSLREICKLKQRKGKSRLLK